MKKCPYILVIAVGWLITLVGCQSEESPQLTLESAFVGSIPLTRDGRVTLGVAVDQTIVLYFSATVNRATLAGARLSAPTGLVDIEVSFLDSDRRVVLRPQSALLEAEDYEIELPSSIVGARGEPFNGEVLKMRTVSGQLRIQSFWVGDIQVQPTSRILDLPRTPTLHIDFSASLDPQQLSAVSWAGPGAGGPVLVLSNQNRRLTIQTGGPLQPLSRYTLSITNTLRGVNQEPFAGFTQILFTEADPTPKFPLLPDDELLTLVQQQTFRYFWDLAHPASGMARERNTSGDLVTSGGSGFGLMAILVGIERGFITRAEGVSRITTVLNFLETADRFRGAWPHWMNGNTGRTIPFSLNDNGGDLVETSLLMQGLLTVRQYLDGSISAEQQLIARINQLWRGVEWDWYRRNESNVLYWHWSPDKAWSMNLPVQGWNECMITYILAAASPTHSIPKSVYDVGWARNGNMQNGSQYEGILLPLGSAFGGPLFFAHYSFLGLDPRQLSDAYANYWQQNVNHSLINQRYCARNPLRFAGYSESCWGLTASDNHTGYSAHSPTNDLGVVTPTAALSSFPYTPNESMAALKFFYYTYGDRLWGPYGFYDAFNVTEGWVANSYLAIDQGPIILMIENHRTGLLWNLFMSAPEVQEGLQKLQFTW